MKAHGVPRLACVSSREVSTEEAPGERLFYRKVLDPYLRSMGRTLYEDMRRLEAIVRDSGLDWTIIPPAGLFDGSSVTEYLVTQERLAGRFTSRADLANALLREVVDDGHVRAVLHVLTTEGVPSFRQVFLKEAFGIGK